MEFIRGLRGLKDAHRGAAITVGSFDGIHLGHGGLIASTCGIAKQLAKPAMMLTFEPLPREYLSPQDPPARLTDFRERWRVLERSDLHYLCVLRFDEKLRQLSGEQFVELLRQLVPSPEWLELLKQTVLSIWHEELGQASDVRENVQKRVTQTRARLRRLDEAFLYESSIDRTTYEELRDKLREELTLAELELSEAQVEQFDIDNALAKAISVLKNASALWIDASLEDRLQLQEVLFPQGLVWDGNAFQTPVTCLSFYHLEPIAGPVLTPPTIDGVQTPPISLISNELSRESRAEVNDGTGTGIRTPV